ncbi:transposase domain-containing protein [Kitasatospora sp. NBC_00240]|uniref:transposase domain-containing protein n=1 Tax=Kitasatospora sp. NBC_00240 TaxID=2903567 RepID=UPI0022539172|nr:transposase domain-containing protein [Kitasatospora sp. NBC_00240]MCX5208388.1 transposase domain-containing protein [Kitasatospora sp. NBC_00240]
MLLDGSPLAHMPPTYARRSGIRVIPQGHAIIPHVSPAENVHVAALPRAAACRFDRTELNRRITTDLRCLGFSILNGAVIIHGRVRPTIATLAAFWQNVTQGTLLVAGVVIRQRRTRERPVGPPSPCRLLWSACRVAVVWRGWSVESPAGERLSDRIAIGVLTRAFPPGLVDEVIAEAGRAEQRSRLLPARGVVHFVLATCLFFDQEYEEVARLLGEGVGDRRRAWQVPTTAAIGRALRRLRPDPLRLLFQRGVPRVRCPT